MTIAHEGSSATLSIGRGSDNDIVVDEPLVSRRHARLQQTGDGWELVDLGSTNGTFVEGRRLTRGRLEPGQRVAIGRSRFIVTDDGLEEASPDEAPALQARHVSVVVDGDELLDDVNFTLERGGLMAIVGPTGSGKTTLLKALTGFQPPDEGEVYVNGRELYGAFDEVRRHIGYVPQEEVLHRPLTIKRALMFASVLRLPADTNRREREQRVDDVIERLGLTDRADLPIERGSGGERKRTNVALELLSEPEILFLDEPTSGLDPGFEKTLMECVRDIARDGRSVVVVTHTLQSMDLCDRVLMFAQGGRVAFFGSPDEIKSHFGKDDVAEIFRELDMGVESSRAAEVAPAAAPPAAPPGEAPLPAQIGRLRQLALLTTRQAAIVAVDWRNYLYYVAEVAIPALLILALVGPHALEPGAQEATQSARTLLGALALAAVVIGVANTIREVVKEVPIYLRERAVGLSRAAYVGAKLIAFGFLTTIQVVVLTHVTTRGSGGPEDSLFLHPHLAELALDVSLAGIAAVALGLLLSSFVSSSEKAMSLIPVVFLVAWLLSGIAIDLNDKPLLRRLAYANPANWAVAMEAASLDLCEVAQLPDADGAADMPTCDWRWKPDQDLWKLSAGVTLGMTVAASVGSVAILAPKEPSHRRLLRRRRSQHRRRRREARSDPGGGTDTLTA